MIGATGIEVAEESFISGRSGERWVMVSAVGRQLGVVSEIAPRAGHDVGLTIDVELQRAAAEALGDQFRRRGGPRSAKRRSASPLLRAEFRPESVRRQIESIRLAGAAGRPVASASEPMSARGLPPGLDNQTVPRSGGPGGGIDRSKRDSFLQRICGSLRPSIPMLAARGSRICQSRALSRGIM